mgnify:CR=1 FL=1
MVEALVPPRLLLLLLPRHLVCRIFHHQQQLPQQPWCWQHDRQNQDEQSVDSWPNCLPGA